jgi:hypothetical protein
MRVVAMVAAAGVVLGGALGAAAQNAPPPVTGGTNTNSVSGGSSSNTNANSNSQFLSGSNTGVNNGSLEVYAGADPYQGIIFGGSTNLPQLPGIPSPPSNFSQPYRPDAFVNTPPFLPTEMTLEDAKRCRDAKASWYGGSVDGEVPAIKLFYAGKPETPSVALTMANYVGTAMATTADGPFLAALCEAAYRAIRKGATVGLVEFTIRPKNTMVGLGFGTSGGATGLPVTGAHPYALAGTLGFGTGWSNQRVEGEVVLQLTALRGAPVASSESSSSSPAASVVTPTSPVTPPPADDATVPGPGASLRGRHPAAAARDLLTAAPSAAIRPAEATRPGPGISPDHRREPLSAPPREGELAMPAAAVVSQTDGLTPGRGYHSARRLTGLRTGQSKEHVFGLFSSMVATQDQKIVEIQGMRLRASGQAAGGARIEVGEVSLTDGSARETLYWFLFSDGRLLAWGRPEQWSAAATRYGVDLPYRPSLSQVEAKVDLACGRHGGAREQCTGR